MYFKQISFSLVYMTNLSSFYLLLHYIIIIKWLFNEMILRYAGHPNIIWNVDLVLNYGILLINVNN